MGQQFHTQSTESKTSEFDLDKMSHVEQQNSKLGLLTNSQGQCKSLVSNSINQLQNIIQYGEERIEQLKICLQREQLLIQFIGEIIYYCKLQMKRQKKYYYKISALLFYKYFYDKFRELQCKYCIMYKKKIVSREQYEKKMKLVSQVKDTFIKIKKFVYNRIPFLNEQMTNYLNEQSQELCFQKKQFFTQFLHKQVKEIMEFYQENSKGQFTQHGINICYLRMLKAIFIIQQLEFRNPLIKPELNQLYPNYHLQKLETMTEEEVKASLSESYKLFLTLEHT